ncbi:MAG: alkaline phosphatase family protein [Brevefilum sp.]|jgi:predicted AlkP superfamily pyrophosphatase or phosphodiesterase
MPKLLVFCLDALCTSDLDYMKTLPNFSWVFENGSYVKHAEPVYPSLTYPCHVSILTGNYVNKHQVPHNEIVAIGKMNQPWYNQRSDVKSETLLDVAKKHGYSTCSLSWPVTGGAGFDLNMPMIVPIGYTGYEPIQFLVGNATEELLEKYYEKHGHFLMGEDRSLDKYTMALALDILKDYPQPDIMLVKMCDLDSAHHEHGVHHPKVNEQLDLHDQQFGQILDLVRTNGDFENTNFVILGDHGQSDITEGININVLLKQNGFITVDDQDNFVDFEAYGHSASLSAWIELKDNSDAATYERVYNFLNDLVQEKKFGIGHLYTRQEAEDLFNLTGPLDFIIEGEKPVAFSSTLEGESIYDKPEYKGFPALKASHGGLPWKDETTAFIACGPGVKRGVVIDRCSIVDEAPTMAAMMGFEMHDIDGKILTEILI